MGDRILLNIMFGNMISSKNLSAEIDLTEANQHDMIRMILSIIAHCDALSIKPTQLLSIILDEMLGWHGRFTGIS